MSQIIIGTVSFVINWLIFLNNFPYSYQNYCFGVLIFVFTIKQRKVGMEVYSVGTTSSPNFGMALRIDPKAEDFIKALPAKERAYLRSLGKKIANSRNNIDIIGANGNVSYSYSPTKVLLTGTESEAEAWVKEQELFNKRVKKEVSIGEKFELVVDAIETLFKVLAIKLSFWKSKFMRSLQIGEQYVKAADFYDSVHQKAKTRLDIRDEQVAKIVEDIMKNFKY